MTWSDDYSGEMPGRQIDDATAEQLVAGRTAPPELESVATVMRALREVAAHPVPPSTTLRQQMAAGVFTGSPVYAYRPDRPGLLHRYGSALAARVARMRLATKFAAAGVVVAVLSAGTAGFAGTLPTPVQDRFETVVESVTPYQFPEKTANPGDDPGGGGPRDERPAGGTTDEAPAGGNSDQGGVGEPAAPPTPPASSPTGEPVPSPTGEPGNSDAPGNGNGNGNGNGQGNGNGNDKDKDKGEDGSPERPRD